MRLPGAWRWRGGPSLLGVGGRPAQWTRGFWRGLGQKPHGEQLFHALDHGVLARLGEGDPGTLVLAGLAIQEAQVTVGALMAGVELHGVQHLVQRGLGAPLLHVDEA